MATGVNVNSEPEYKEIYVKQLPSDVFIILSDNLTSDWEKVASMLSFNNSDIQFFQKFYCTYEKTFQMFLKWRRKNPLEKWGKLKSILTNIGRMDLVLECESKLRPLLSTLPTCKKDVDVEYGKKRDVDVEYGEKTKSCTSLYGVQPPCSTFFARKKELDQISQGISEFKNSGKWFLVITGMSGIGKTQLVRKYVEKFHEIYKNIVWIDAAHDKINNSMINLCHQLGVSIKDSKNVYYSNETIIAKIHSHYTGKTLYIYDNIDDESVKNFEKYVSHQADSYTLATSQWKCWSPNALVIQIEPFSAEIALDFLKKYIEAKSEKEISELKIIIEALRYHPLALNQALLYIKYTNVSLQDYLNLFQSHPVDVLEEFLHTEEESKSAIASINMVLNKFKTGNETLALNILYCLSYCDGRSITREFLKEVSAHLKQNDDYYINHAIILMTNFSLLNQSDLRAEAFSMHEITQLACRHFQKQNQVEKGTIICFMREKLLGVKDNSEYGYIWYKHFLHMFWKNKKEMAQEFSKFSKKIFVLLASKGLFEDLFQILEEIEEFQREKCGINDSSTLNTIHYKARCRDSMGRYEEAFKIYSDVEKSQIDKYGRSHNLTMTTKNNKALCLINMGKAEEAFQIYSEVEKFELETLGKECHSTLITKNNKALCMYHMGNVEEAFQEFSKVETIQTKVLGNRHIDTLATKINKGSCIEDMGNYTEAIKIYSEVEKVETEILGNSHPSTLTTKHIKAYCMYKMGELEDAFQLYSEVEKLQVATLGNKHPSTLTTKYNKALCMERMGKFKEASKDYSYVRKLEQSFKTKDRKS